MRANLVHPHVRTQIASWLWLVSHPGYLKRSEPIRLPDGGEALSDITGVFGFAEDIEIEFGSAGHIGYSLRNHEEVKCVDEFVGLLTKIEYSLPRYPSRSEVTEHALFPELRQCARRCLHLLQRNDRKVGEIGITTQYSRD